MLKLTPFAALVAATLMAPATWAHGPAGAADPAQGVPADIPAPTVTLPEATWRLGDLTLAAPYARATLPNAPVAGGFLTITHHGDRDDRLVAASSAIAGRVEIHEMVMNGDIMTMSKLADGLPLPAGETVLLQPGGYHLMFMQLTGPLVEGETVPVTLTFETAGEITVPLSVLAFNARGAGDGAPGADPHAGHGS